MDIDVTDPRSPYFGYPKDRPVPSAWNLLSMSNLELTELDVPGRRITALRIALTGGHHRAIARPWLWAVGLFGCTHTAEEIAEILGTVDADAVRSYARGRRLYIAREDRRMLPSTIGMQVALRFDENPATIARALGLLPMEVVLYRQAVVSVLEKPESPTEMDWEDLWKDAQPAIPDDQLPRDIRERRRELWSR